MRGFIDWICGFLKWILTLLEFFNKKQKNLTVVNSRTSDNELKSVSPPPRQVDTVPPKQLYAGAFFKFKPGKRDEALAILYRGSCEHELERKGPTKSQLDLVMTEQVGVPVIAGAGSGKSTSLISRLLVMSNFLGISVSNISVFTFTRRSREEFIDNLVSESQFWPNSLNEVRASRLVRTFHSKALEIARPLLGTGSVIFEFLKEERQSSNSLQALNSKEIDELETANQLASIFPEDLNAVQFEILEEAYSQAFANDFKFRQLIQTLLKQSLESPHLEQDEKVDKALRFADDSSVRDLEFVEIVEADWLSKGLWPIPGISTRDENGQRFTLEAFGKRFIANGYIKATNTYVVLGADSSIGDKMFPVKLHHKSKKPISYGLASITKQRILLSTCSEPIRFVYTEKAIYKLKRQVTYLDVAPASGVPKFLFLPAGELDYEPIFSALYKTGIFAENLGLNPEKLEQLPGLTIESVNDIYMKAVAKFYKEFYAILERKKIVTFNQIFYRLAHDSSWIERLESSSLLSMQHLLIDEFQDISPAIVCFILAMHNRLYAISNKRLQPTLMCVGDDWQSIYGWRGSSPQYFIKFSHHFSGAQQSPIQLYENFRSSQKIVSAGEATLRDLKESFPGKKKGIARNISVLALPHKVTLISKYNKEDVIRIIQSILAKKTKKERVFVLTRSKNNETFVAIESAFRHLEPFDFTATTFHQSKGLQADYVFLIGDTSYFGTNPLRNAMYKAAKFESSVKGSNTPYDDAQRDEALRLAYVGITRAKKRCFWFCEPSDNGTFERMPQDSDFCERRSLKQVEAELSNLTT